MRNKTEFENNVVAGLTKKWGADQRRWPMTVAKVRSFCDHWMTAGCMPEQAVRDALAMVADLGPMPNRSAA